MNIIASYTRADAIADEVLIDVSAMARKAGFKVPVSITKNVWVDCVQWTEETESRKDAIQDEEGCAFSGVPGCPFGWTWILSFV